MGGAEADALGTVDERGLVGLPAGLVFEVLERDPEREADGRDEAAEEEESVVFVSSEASMMPERPSVST